HLRISCGPLNVVSKHSAAGRCSTPVVSGSTGCIHAWEALTVWQCGSPLYRRAEYTRSFLISPKGAMSPTIVVKHSPMAHGQRPTRLQVLRAHSPAARMVHARHGPDCVTLSGIDPIGGASIYTSICWPTYTGRSSRLKR